MYQRHGVPIVLFAFRGEHMSLPAQQNTLPNGQSRPHVRSASGRPVVMWQRDGMVYSLVGDMHRDDLEQVVKTVQYR
jgi:anti-sigma factor RsiW